MFHPIKFFTYISLLAFLSCNVTSSSNNSTDTDTSFSHPLLGWNSYTGYGNSLNESAFIENLNAFCQDLKPLGYEYFVIDAGWDGVNEQIKLDSFGRSIPDTHYFPNGLKPLIDLTHSRGVKFGLWVARGISREAVKKNLPIKGTPYFAQDIASTTDTSSWFLFNYGIDMSKPGAQEYYNSVISLIGSWGVDFIKYDDVVPHPDEIIAISKAIKASGYDIKLSLSPGDEAILSDSIAYYNSDMVRITSDVWDQNSDIEKSFALWERFQYFNNTKCKIDLDMIPFGTVFYPTRHQDNYSQNQKYVFITQRSMAASPLFIGGELPRIDAFSLSLVTNRNMLECNQIGTIGKLISRQNGLDIWKSVNRKDTTESWIGIFNRTDSELKQEFTNDSFKIGLELSKYRIVNIWKDSELIKDDSLELLVPAFGVIFLKIFH